MTLAAASCYDAAMRSLPVAVRLVVCNAGLAFLASACQLVLDPDSYSGGNGGSNPDGGPGTDGGSTLQCDNEQTFAHLKDISLPSPGEALVLDDTSGNYSLDTDGLQLSHPAVNLPAVALQHIKQADGTMAAVLVVPRFEIARNAILRATGTRPLIIVSTGDILVGGEIDVSSSATGKGAGANTAPGCAAGGDGKAGLFNAAGGRGGGGGGGGFGAPGGAGGDGDTANTTGGSRGGSNLASFTESVRGGCQGGGGRTSTGEKSGGEGGGAIQLSACGMIQLTSGAFLRASGASGSADTTVSGSGGGSGGYIGLDANRVIAQALPPIQLLANGGDGGPGTSSGGVGGNFGMPQGADGSSDTSGGGGGGGVGVIWIRSKSALTFDNVDVSPKPLCDNMTTMPPQCSL